MLAVVFAWVLGTGIPVLGIGLVALAVITDNDVENTDTTTDDASFSIAVYVPDVDALFALDK